MPLPMSKNAIKMLGKRLADSPELTEDDLGLLEELIQCHAEVLTIATERLADLSGAGGLGPVAITHRAKTTQTIIEKLRRQPNMDLARMQDLAGVRLVGPLSLAEQNALAEEIARRFPADPREPKIIDRRAAPSWGYRAVHVIASVDGVSVEVQVRTGRQHLWANLTERLGDTIGRGIRYGEPPYADTPFIQAFMQGLQSLSDRLYEIECDPTSTPHVVSDDGSTEPATAEAIATFASLVLTDQQT